MMANRAWCDVCQFAGKSKFAFGTVFASKEESEARPRMEQALAEVFPMVPEILAMLPGQIVFQPE